jgi:hypothetical protein
MVAQSIRYTLPIEWSDNDFFQQLTKNKMKQDWKLAGENYKNRLHGNLLQYMDMTVMSPLSSLLQCTVSSTTSFLIYLFKQNSTHFQIQRLVWLSSSWKKS